MERLQAELSELRARSAKAEADYKASQAEARALRDELIRRGSAQNARIESENGASSDSDGDANDASSAPPRVSSSSAEGRVKLADHPLSRLDPKNFALDTYKGPFAVASWWYDMQLLIEEEQIASLEQNPPFPTNLGMMAVRRFLVDTTKRTGLGTWLTQLVKGKTRLNGFPTWDAARKAISQHLITPSLAHDMDMAFYALELKGNDLETFLNAADTYFSASGRSPDVARILLGEKLNNCLSKTTIGELGRYYPNIKLTDCTTDEMETLKEKLYTLASEAAAKGEKISRATPHTSSGPKGGNARAAALQAEEESKSPRSLVAALTPGGSHDTTPSKGGKRGEGKRSTWTPREIAERACANHVKLVGKADLDTVTQRVAARVCRVCGDKAHHTDSCPCKEFQKSN